MNVEMGNVSPGHMQYRTIPDDMTDSDIQSLADEWGVQPHDDIAILKARMEAVTDFNHVHGRRTTSIQIPQGVTIANAYQTIVAPDVGVWDNHSSAPPAWVESDSPGLAALLSEHYNCPIGRGDWQDDY